MDKPKKNNRVQQSLVYSGLSLSFFASSFFTHQTYAQTLFAPHLRTEVQGSFISNNANFMGDIDSLLSLYNNQDNFLFTAFTGRYNNNNSWLVSPGAAFRGLHNNQLFGVYGFADYQQTNPKANFWVINPGLEWMSPRWDAHVNGYFPTETQQEKSPKLFGSDLGDYSHVSFSNHTQFDEVFATMVGIGNGVDAELGYSFALKGYRGRVFGGGYAYATNLIDTKNIQGGLVGIQLPLGQYTDVLVTNSYNNLTHNSIALTLRATWGANRQFTKNVEDRLFDRIERHSGIIQAGSGMLAQQQFIDTGKQATYRSNIWFFKPNVGNGLSLITSNECTYEHPCSNFSQSMMDGINNLAPNASFYFAPGTYPLGQNSLTVNTGQSVFGRDAQYIRPAEGVRRALFTGAIHAQGTNTFDSIRVLNTGIKNFDQLYFENGIAALVMPQNIGAQTVYVNNSQLIADASAGTPSTSSYTSALIAANGVLNINNSTLESNNPATDMDNSSAYGLLALNQAQVTGVNNGVSTSGQGRTAYGIATFNASSLNLINSVISANMTGEGTAQALDLRDYSKAHIDSAHISASSIGQYAFGVTTNQQSQLYLNHATVSANTSAAGIARGIYLRENSKSGIYNSLIQAKATQKLVYGVLTEQQSNLDMNHNIIKAQMDGTGEAIGVNLRRLSQATISNSSISAQSNGATSYGILGQNESNFTLKHSTISSTMLGAGGGQGIQLSGNTRGSISDLSTVNVNSSGALAIGVLSLGTSNLSLQDTRVDVHMTGLGEAQGFNLSGQSQTTVESASINVRADNNFALGAWVTNESKLTLNASNINISSQGNATGLRLENMSTVTAVNNSQINNVANGSLAFGALLLNNSSLTISNSIISSNMKGSGGTNGVQLNDTSKLRMFNSIIQSQAAQGLSVGILSFHKSSASVSNSKIYSTTLGALGEADGLQLQDTSKMSINKTEIFLSSTRDAYGTKLLGQTNKLLLNDSTINIKNTSMNGVTIGIFNTLGSSALIDNSSLILQGPNAQLVNGQATFSQNSTCIVNGDKISCP